MKGVVKNYVFANSQDRTPDDSNIPSDYILYARFNGNYKDRSSNSNHLQLFNYITPIFTIGRKNRKAISFNGEMDGAGVITTSAINYSSNQVTLSLWLFIEEIGGAKRFFYSNVSGTGAGSWGLFLGSSATVGSANYDKLMIYYRSATNGNNIVRTSVAPPVNQWIHVVVVINKNSTPQYKLLINNVAQTLVNVNSAPDTSNFVSDIMRLGVSYKGKVQNMRIYNRELTPTEITNLYNELL